MLECTPESAIATLCVLCDQGYVGVILNCLIYIILLQTEVVQWIDKNPGDYMDIWQPPRTALLENAQSNLKDLP